MPPKKMLSLLFLQYGTPWLVAALTGLIVFLVLGFVIDYRFFILSLIWIFLFIPLVVAFLYFLYGMKPFTAFNSIPHKLLFNEKELRVRIIEHNVNEEEKIENEEETITPIDEKKDYTVNKSLIESVKRGGDYVLLFSKQNGMLWVPVFAFDSISDFKNILSYYI